MHNGKSHETRQEKFKSNIQLTLTQSRLRRLPSVDIFFHMVHLKLIIMHHPIRLEKGIQNEMFVQNHYKN